MKTTFLNILINKVKELGEDPNTMLGPELVSELQKSVLDVLGS